MKIFGIFASGNGSFYITDRKNPKIRYQYSVLKALYDIRAHFDSQMSQDRINGKKG
jgi:hypothetical protein